MLNNFSYRPHDVRLLRFAIRGVRGLWRRLAHATGIVTVTEQLEMFWVRTDRSPDVVVPAGFVLRPYLHSDRAEYERLISTAFSGTGWIDYWLRERTLDKGCFVIEEAETGVLVAACTAGREAEVRHADSGNLGWLVTDPHYGGRGLGKAVTAAVMRRLVREGFRENYLRTDDHRNAAISIYLNMGWAPNLSSEAMVDRWEAVFSRLNREFAPLSGVRANSA